MSDARSITESAQTQTLDFVRQSQEAFVEAMQVWSDSMSRMMGAVQQRTTDVGELPKPEEVVDQVFDFAQSLLNAQREFAQNVMQTTSGMWATGEQVIAQQSSKAAGAAKSASNAKAKS